MTPMLLGEMRRASLGPAPSKSASSTALIPPAMPRPGVFTEENKGPPPMERVQTGICGMSLRWLAMFDAMCSVLDTLRES